MQQVIWNLLANAIKFTPERGVVRVNAEREGSSIVMSVTDTGIGISAEFLPYVFERFRQQDSASTRAHGGLGLGLSIVRHLSELHGGSVEARQRGRRQGGDVHRAGAGCTGAGRRAGSGRRARRAIRRLPSSPRSSGITVLVVDNEADTRALVRAILEECGARVIEADGARQALAMIEADTPDVLLSDIAMPGEDGYSLIRKVRALRGPERLLPSAAFTAFATAADRARALLAGYQAHMPKPVEPSELAAVVAALAGRTVARN